MRDDLEQRAWKKETVLVWSPTRAHPHEMWESMALFCTTHTHKEHTQRTQQHTHSIQMEHTHTHTTHTNRTFFKGVEWGEGLGSFGWTELMNLYALLSSPLKKGWWEHYLSDGAVWEEMRETLKILSLLAEAGITDKCWQMICKLPCNSVHFASRASLSCVSSWLPGHSVSFADVYVDVNAYLRLCPPTPTPPSK